MGLISLFRKRPQMRDVDILARRTLQLVESARGKNASELASEMSRSYAWIYSKGNPKVREYLAEFTRTMLSDTLLRLREPQTRGVPPGVKMPVQNGCVLEHMALFTFLSLVRDFGEFPEIEALYTRELDASTKPQESRRSNVIVADFAKAMEEVKKDKGRKDK